MMAGWVGPCVQDTRSTQMAVQVERRTIDVIPDAERHGTPRDQFTLWFGANMQITAIVDGASRRRVRCGRVVGDHRAADRQHLRRCGDGAALGAGPADGHPADDLQPRPVRCPRGLPAAGAGGVDVPRVRRHRHCAVGAGDQRDPQRRRPGGRHRHLRRPDDDRRHGRLPPDPHLGARSPPLSAPSASPTSRSGC